jgi:hypothetical protein
VPAEVATTLAVAAHVGGRHRETARSSDGVPHPEEDDRAHGRRTKLRGR